MSADFTKSIDRIVKIDERLGLVFGFAEIFSDADGEYFDLQGDARTEKAAIEAWADFHKAGQVLGDMHNGEDSGDVVFSFPLTEDIAKALDIDTEIFGMLVGIKPSPEMLEKFVSGEYTGFSIGGTRLEEEVVEA